MPPPPLLVLIPSLLMVLGPPNLSVAAVVYEPSPVNDAAIVPLTLQSSDKKTHLEGGPATAPGVHLSLGSDPGDVVVTWSSSLVNASSGAHASLSYGSSPTVLSSTVLATSLNNLSRISLNRATIKGVVPESTVYYRVSSDKRVLNFTHRTPHGRKGPATFAVFGDLGIKEQDGANWTLARLKQHHIAHDFESILHVGDIAYDLQDNGGKTGDEFLQDWEPVASQVPYMTVPGNHERDDQDKNDPVYLNYRTRFSMPSPAGDDPRHQPMYWSVDVGSAHIIGINTDAYYFSAPAQQAAVQEQYAWLEADLERAVTRRAEIPWIIVIGHQMLYSTHDSGHVSQAAMLRAGLESLFRAYSVDLYFSGHEHVYERFDRIFDSNVCNASAPSTRAATCGLSPPCPCTAHIVVGNAGNREFPYHTTNGSVMDFEYSQPVYERFRTTWPAGYGLLRVANDSTMIWKQYNARTGTVIDTHVFLRATRPQPQPPAPPPPPRPARPNPVPTPAGEHWECRTNRSDGTLLTKAHLHDELWTGVTELNMCKGICNALPDCAVFRLHFTDSNCHTMSGPITHDEFLASLVQYNAETSCIRLKDE